MENKKRLIDANSLIKEAYADGAYGYVDAEQIADAPTIDAVEVVRCRECKWWHEDDGVGYCDNPDGLDNYAKPDEFCSYGERRGGDD